MGDVSFPPTDPASIPKPALSAPPGVSDKGSAGAPPVGEAPRYAMENHTHASKARKQIVTMQAAASTFKWVFPLPFDEGVVPVCNAIVQVAANNADLFNVQILGKPTATDVTFQINRVSAGLLSLLAGALSVNPQPVAATLHMIALEP